MAIRPPAGLAKARQPPAESDLMKWAREAWARSQPGGPEPERVEVLTRKTKSSVCRLLGTEAAGFPVVAKRARKGTAELEAAVHEDILPRLSVSAVEWRGIVPASEDAGFCWLFMGDAGETPVGPRSRHHRGSVARWLADLHAGSEGLEASATLPDRGPRDALARLRKTRATIQRGAENAAPMPPEDRAGIAAILAQLDIVELRWHEIEARCQEFPRTLVHGDFVKKNMRLRDGRGGAELLVFDWEHAGFGFPGQDLDAVDPACYGAALREHWPGMDAQQVRRLVETGRFFRMVARTRWMAGGLGMPGCDWVAEILATYACEFDRMARDAGWSQSAS